MGADVHPQGHMYDSTAVGALEVERGVHGFPRRLFSQSCGGASYRGGLPSASLDYEARGTTAPPTAPSRAHRPPTRLVHTPGPAARWSADRTLQQMMRIAGVSAREIARTRACTRSNSEAHKCNHVF